MLAWGLAAAAVVFFGARALGHRDAQPAAGGAVRVEAPASRSAGGGRGGGGVYVHVTGAVRRPGLYRVASGARVAAAVHRAGGPSRRADLVTVNLAAKVQDGQQVIVPVRGAAAGPAGAASPGSAGTAGAGATAATGASKISLATATGEQLDGLDGIGPTLAKRIIEYRTEHGGFRSVAELQQVDGIGAKRFEALRDAVQP